MHHSLKYMQEESADEGSKSKKVSENKHEKHAGVAPECQDKTISSTESKERTKETYFVGRYF